MFIATDFILDQHISKFTSKATGTIEILRRDLSFALAETKAAAYELLVEPKLEYIIYPKSLSLNSDFSRLTRSTEQQLGGSVSNGATQLVVICSSNKD